MRSSGSYSPGMNNASSSSSSSSVTTDILNFLAVLASSSLQQGSSSSLNSTAPLYPTGSTNTRGLAAIGNSQAHHNQNNNQEDPEWIKKQIEQRENELEAKRQELDFFKNKLAHKRQEQVESENRLQESYKRQRNMPPTYPGASAMGSYNFPGNNLTTHHYHQSFSQPQQTAAPQISYNTSSLSALTNNSSAFAMPSTSQPRQTTVCQNNYNSSSSGALSNSTNAFTMQSFSQPQQTAVARSNFNSASSGALSNNNNAFAMQSFSQQQQTAVPQSNYNSSSSRALSNNTNAFAMRSFSQPPQAAVHQGNLNSSSSVTASERPISVTSVESQQSTEQDSPAGVLQFLNQFGFSQTLKREYLALRNEIDNIPCKGMKKCTMSYLSDEVRIRLLKCYTEMSGEFQINAIIRQHTKRNFSEMFHFYMKLSSGVISKIRNLTEKSRPSSYPQQPAVHHSNFNSSSSGALSNSANALSMRPFSQPQQPVVHHSNYNSSSSSTLANRTNAFAMPSFIQQQQTAAPQINYNSSSSGALVNSTNTFAMRPISQQQQSISVVGMLGAVNTMRPQYSLVNTRPQLPCSQVPAAIQSGSNVSSSSTTSHCAQIEAELSASPSQASSSGMAVNQQINTILDASNDSSSAATTAPTIIALARPVPVLQTSSALSSHVPPARSDLSNVRSTDNNLSRPYFGSGAFIGVFSNSHSQSSSQPQRTAVHQSSLNSSSSAAASASPISDSSVVSQQATEQDSPVEVLQFLNQFRFSQHLEREYLDLRNEIDKIPCQGNNKVTMSNISDEVRIRLLKCYSEMSYEFRLNKILQEHNKKNFREMFHFHLKLNSTVIDLIRRWTKKSRPGNQATDSSISGEQMLGEENSMRPHHSLVNTSLQLPCPQLPVAIQSGANVSSSSTTSHCAQIEAELLALPSQDGSSGMAVNQQINTILDANTNVNITLDASNDSSSAPAPAPAPVPQTSSNEDYSSLPDLYSFIVRARSDGLALGRIDTNLSRSASGSSQVGFFAHAHAHAHAHSQSSGDDYGDPAQAAQDDQADQADQAAQAHQAHQAAQDHQDDLDDQENDPFNLKC